MFQFFQPKIQSFGIDLSDFSIKIISLEKSKKISLASFGRQEIASGIIEEGEIKKETELIETIKKATKEIKGAPLKNKHCVVSLPETESFIRILQLPMMEKEEVGEAIKWEIETNIPLSLNEIYYDWQIISDQNKNGNQQRLDILVGVLPKKTVDPYLSVLKNAGLKPTAFEIESLAIARSLMKDAYCQEPTLIIDLGAKKTSLVIFCGQAVYFTASLPVSNFSLITTLGEKLNIAYDQARQLKIQQGLGYENPQNQIFQALKPALDEMANKIKNYIDFFEFHASVNLGAPNNKIKKAILCGGGANFSGIEKLLQDELKINVEIGNPWLNVFPGPSPNLSEFPTQEALSYTTAIGLALRGISNK